MNPTDDNELILVDAATVSQYPITSNTTTTSTAFNPYHLFPCPIRSNAFTTLPSSVCPIHPRIQHVPLSDESLSVTKITSGTSREIISAPGLDNRIAAWEAVYPKGSINPGNPSAPRGGFGFYVGGPEEEMGWCFERAKEVLFSYAVYFEPGFEFNRGGKLPGLYGGSTREAAYGCSGGRKTDREKCFSLRLMWRRNGDAEIYAYLPLNETNKSVLSQVPPKSKLNPDYGFSVGTGSFKFVPGEWAVVAQRVKLNDEGAANGELDLWVNGEKVISVCGIIVREDPDCVVRGAHFQTFFGGNSEEWASPKDQCAYFAA
ncbi:hypothetical protein FRB90_009269, partial [Tulasnella sp. 427]